MKNIFFKLGVAAMALGTFVACEKDETQAVYNANATPQLTASATSATITRNSTSPAVTYSWNAADFNYPAAVTYTLQFAKAGTNFAKTTDYPLDNALTKSFNVTELNEVYNNVDCNLPDPAGPTPAPPVTLEVRVKASVGDGAPALYSPVKAITATPYPAVTIPSYVWGLVGPAGDGWPGATPTDRILTYDCKIRAYTLTTNLNAGEFKFRRNRDWGTNLGGPAGDFTKGVTLAPNGANLVIATAGTYTIKLEIAPDPNAVAVTGGKVTITK